MDTAVTIDMAGGQVGGAARFRSELNGYLERHGRRDVKVIGAGRDLSAGWLAAREASAARRGRRIAVNNVGFMTPGGERWTLLRNALHFLTASEASSLDPGLRAAVTRQAAIVHRAARRSDVVVAPCTAMGERISSALPEVAGRLAIRMHPVTGRKASPPQGSLVLCPVLFASYKHMPDRIADWLAAVGDAVDDSVRLIVTASAPEVPGRLAASPRLHFVGRLTTRHLAGLWDCCRAVYFPTVLESFGFPLAEARAQGRPVIAADTPQNREIASRALCGYLPGDRDSLRQAISQALAAQVTPDPGPFDPDSYFDWMLGEGVR